MSRVEIMDIQYGKMDINLIIRTYLKHLPQLGGLDIKQEVNINDWIIARDSSTGIDYKIQIKDFVSCITKQVKANIKKESK